MARSRALVVALPLLAVVPAMGRGALAQSACGSALEYGMNPSFHTWTSRAIVFGDAMMRARELSRWREGAPDGPAPLIPLGQGRLGEGWPDPAALGPDERVGAMLFGSMEHTLPDGGVEPYVIVWRGSGHVRLEGPNVVREQARTDNRVEVLVDPALGNGNSPLTCTWTSPDPADPVRDVHVWLPGMEAQGTLLWPPFVDKVRALDAGRGPHTWRTLDWTRVNEYGRPLDRDGFVFDIAGVIRPSSPSQGTLRGVCPQFQVALCNELRMNLHFNVPHRTDDMDEVDYVRFLEGTFRVLRDGSPNAAGVEGGRRFAGLAPGLTVTIELSNEMWNPIFPVNGWMVAEAQRKGLSFQEEVASQIQIVFDAADRVFAGPDALRLKKYVGGFIGDPLFLRRVLSYLRSDTRIDAVGPAVYLGPREPDLEHWLEDAVPGSCPSCPDARELLAAARSSIDARRPRLAAHREIAQEYTNPDGSHPALVLYEGGLNLKSAGKPWAAAAREVQVLPELFALLADDYVQLLVDEGVELVNWYSFMSDQDSLSVDAYGVWNDMQQELELPIVRPYPGGIAPKAAVVCLGPPPAASCPAASATWRSGPGNADSYRAWPPVLGTWFRARVDLTTTGHTGAFVACSLRPESLPVPGGGTVLTGLNGAEFLPLRRGPIALWYVPVPNDPTLAGVAVATQAIHLGGGGGPALSNAMDLVFGR